MFKVANTRSFHVANTMGGDNKTIGLGAEAHNQAGSGLVVGKVAGMCGLAGAFDHAVILCGSEPARDEKRRGSRENEPPVSLASISPTDLATRFLQATHPCAFAYNYARIRPLVRLVPGFYRFPGLVARGFPQDA